MTCPPERSCWICGTGQHREKPKPHKIKVFRVQTGRNGGLWYAECQNPNCTTVTTMTVGPNGRYGRSTWEAAFAQGVAHQKEYAQ